MAQCVDPLAKNYDSVSFYAQKFEQEPQSWYFLPLAEAYRRCGMIHEAIDTINQGLKYHPHYPHAFVILGQCLLEAGNPERAVVELERALQTEIYNLLAYQLLTRAYKKLGHLDKAKECHIRLTTLLGGKSLVEPPIFPSATGKMGDFRIRKVQELVKEGAEKWEAPLATEALADLYLKQGYLDRARTIYESILRRDPEKLGIKEKLQKMVPPEEKPTGVVQRQSADTPSPEANVLQHLLSQVEEYKEGNRAEISDHPRPQS